MIRGHPAHGDTAVPEARQQKNEIGLHRPKGAAPLPRNKDLPKWHTSVPLLKLDARYPEPNTTIPRQRQKTGSR
jgi:hypothetical protein